MDCRKSIVVGKCVSTKLRCYTVLSYRDTLKIRHKVSQYVLSLCTVCGELGRWSRYIASTQDVEQSIEPNQNERPNAQKRA